LKNATYDTRIVAPRKQISARTVKNRRVGRDGAVIVGEPTASLKAGTLTTVVIVQILVTGGAGFIGSNLVDLLLAEGHEVKVIDDLSTGRRSNLVHLDGSIEFHEGSILDTDLVSKIVQGTDLVFHLAAAVGVRNIVEAPLKSIRTNVDGTESVLEACVRHDTRVLLASTSEIYGKAAKFPMSEDDDRVIGPTHISRWSYSTSKALDEHLAFAYAAERGLRMSIVRYFNTYGPRLHANGYGSVVASMTSQALANAPIVIHGDGSQTRCFGFVGDTIRGTYLAGTLDGALGQAFNIGASTEISINELAARICGAAGSSSEISHISYDEAYGPGFEDPKRRVPDVRKAAEKLGWAPQVSLDEGLPITVNWWRDNNDQLAATR
jgi:UDP-glucose 4-epimerase